MLWHYEMQGELRVTEVELIWSAEGGENGGGGSEAKRPNVDLVAGFWELWRNGVTTDL